MVINTLKNEAIKEGMEEGLREGLREGRKEGIKQGIKEGKKEGREDGIKESKLSIAKQMLNKNLDINIISECTGISVEELKNLN